MKSTVYYLKTKDNIKPQDLAPQLPGLFDKAGFGNLIKEKDYVAIKLHVGEKGNVKHLDPLYAREIVKKCRAGVPFVTDTNTLYVSARSNAVLHLKTAEEHGFTLKNLGAPFIIADGLVSKNHTPVRINKKHFQEVNIASDIVNTDVLMVMTHVTGHVGIGFGGSLKNVAMGCASRSGKQRQHSNTLPKVNPEKCTACGRCYQYCPEGAIAVGKDSAKIDPAKCVGCAECVVTCRYGAIAVSWSEASIPLQEKIAEYAYGALLNKKGKCGFMNFLVNVSQHCDCIGRDTPKVADDLGVLASTDPVAIDRATLDLLNKHHEKDIFREQWPEIDCTRQLEYGAEIGLGNLEYDLVEI